MTVGALDRDRLAKLLGLLGSDFDGEVLTAARQAERLRRDAGITWNDIVAPVRPALPETRVFGDRAAISICINAANLLTDWERGFVWSLRSQSYPITAKQRQVLRRLVDKAQRSARAAA